MRRLALLALLAVAWPSQASELELVAERVIALHTATGGEGSAPEVSAAVNGLCAGASSLLSTLAPEGRWPDLAYTDTATSSWPVGTHYSRLRTLAQAWRQPSCAGIYRDLATLRRIESALDAASSWYCAECGGLGNWWWWNIGVPSQLAPTLVLLQEWLDPKVFAVALASLDAHVSGQQELTGANLADHAMNLLYLALLQKDPARASAATREMEQLCAIAPAAAWPYLDVDGIKPDFSFHQHSGQLYTGGYGGVFTDNVARFVQLTEGTSFALPLERLATFADYLFYGTVWSINFNDFDPSVLSRGQSRRGNHVGGALNALVRMAQRPSARQAQLLAATQRLLEVLPAGFSVENAPQVAKVRAMSADGGWPLGLRHYPDSDFTVHRRPGWYASVKMLSSRINSGENTNTEGKRFSRQSDGRLFLTLKGDEYQGEVLPTLDWARLPGTTVELTDHAADDSYGPGLRQFVGGSGDGVNGVSAMDFAPVVSSGSKLSARKSWFFFDDAVVFLTSAIACPSANPVQTIIEQWPLSSEDAPLAVDGQAQPTDAGWTGSYAGPGWMASDGLGYWFPAAAPVHASRLRQSGRWSDLGLGSDERVEQPMLTLWMDHGSAPDGGTAAYAIVPGVDAPAMAAWAEKAPLEILANTPELSAVRDSRSGALGAVFWRPGSVSGLSSALPAVAWVRDDGAQLTLWVADPTQLRTTLAFTLEGAFDPVSADPGVVVWQEGPGTRVDFPVSSGRTATATLRRNPPEATAPAPQSCGCETGGGSLLALAALAGLTLVVRARSAEGCRCCPPPRRRWTRYPTPPRASASFRWGCWTRPSRSSESPCRQPPPPTRHWHRCPRRS